MTSEEQEKPLIESKNSFYFGLVTGVAAVSLIGLLFMGSHMAGGQFSLANALNSDNEAVADEDSNVANIKPSKPSQPSPSAVNAGAKVDIKVTKTDRVRGDKKAPITIVEYSDYQCPYCARHHETLKQVMQAYPDKVRWVFKHFPLESIHPYAKKAAEAAECAGDQGKFWEYTDEVFANQGSLSNEYLSTVAQNIGLNTSKFESCLSSGKFTKKVDADMVEGKKLGVQGTPGNFINGRNLAGAVPFADIENIIKAELNN